MGNNLNKVAFDHLTELGAFEVLNPVVAQSITLRRMTEAGHDWVESIKAIEKTMKENRK